MWVRAFHAAGTPRPVPARLPPPPCRPAIPYGEPERAEKSLPRIEQGHSVAGALHGQPVVAAQTSMLPHVLGQSVNGHGAGMTISPAASDCARQF
jgi:hypothetical protein